MHIVVFENCKALSRPIRYRYKSIMAIRSQDKTIVTTRMSHYCLCHKSPSLQLSRVKPNWQPGAKKHMSVTMTQAYTPWRYYDFDNSTLRPTASATRNLATQGERRRIVVALSHPPLDQRPQLPRLAPTSKKSRDLSVYESGFSSCFHLLYSKAVTPLTKTISTNQAPRNLRRHDRCYRMPECFWTLTARFHDCINVNACDDATAEPDLDASNASSQKVGQKGRRRDGVSLA
uniref:Uncharacterized protein n=1 Tax=Panagrellus redivivus TaxID=6233 RepID=A0A7E4UP37_PANRE